MQQKTLGIIGVGLLGCSIALRYRAVYPDHAVIGIDTNSLHLAYAYKHDGLTERVEHLTDLVARVDTLVLATPLASILAALQTLAQLPLAQAGPRLIIDVASVKGEVAAAGLAIPQFIATHPMAGAETSGPQAARADLFMQRPWAYVPTDHAAVSEAALTFIRDMGALPVAISAHEHDLVVARTSHLPQTLSTVLALHALRRPTHGLFGQGLLDMLRLAHSSDAVWNDIYIANRAAIASELQTYIEELQRFAEILQSEDRHALRASFIEANQLLHEMH